MEMVEKLRRGIDLGFDEATGMFSEILEGRVDQPVVEEVLLLLAAKGETEEEIAASARALLDHAVAFDCGPGPLLDTAGTGGDGSGSFNISTAAAIVCSLFVPVAKHGNRAVSSKSGSADFLEALGVPINLDHREAPGFLAEKNFVFLFAQHYHPAMKAVAPVRKKLARRTIFNLLGPLCNPARPRAQLMGVFSTEIMEKYLGAVQFLGIPNAMIVSASDGMDEVSISAPTRCVHKRGSSVRTFQFDPASFGISGPREAMRGYEPDANARIVREAFHGCNHSQLVDAIAVNSAFGLVSAEVEDDLGAAFTLAREAITSGRAYEKLMDLSS